MFVLTEYKQEIANLMKEASEDEAKINAPLFKAAQTMLRLRQEIEVVQLWEKHWVYKGFDVTYRNLGAADSITMKVIPTY